MVDPRHFERFLSKDLQELFKVSDVMSLFVWENSPGWPVLFCTENVKDLLGFTKQEFERRDLTFTDTVHPADLERVADEVEQAISNPGQKSFTHQDYRMVREDGEEIWVADTTVIERNPKGEVVYLVGYLLNITQRKRLELALAAEHDHLAMVIESARLGSWNWNFVTNHIQLNQHWLDMFGLQSKGEAFNYDLWRDHLHPDDRSGWNEALQRHLRGDSTYFEHVYRMQHARGHWLYVLDRGQVVAWDQRHKPLRIAGTLTDITEQKEAELEARRSARNKNTVLANISHEIRTPLHGILGIASVLEESVQDPNQKSLIQTIRESGDYLLNALNDVLDLTRAEAGKYSVIREPHAVDEITRHLRELFYSTAKDQNLQFDVQRMAAVPDVVVVDKSRLLQISVNLLNNAFKFTESGYVRYILDWNTTTEAGELIIRVSDSGVGIEDTEKVWQLFEQETGRPDLPHRQTKGSGVGLSVVKNLVTIMGGQVSVSSNPERGSCFEVRLPAASSEPEPSQSVQAIELPAFRILVVDDSDVNQLVLGEMLARLDQMYVCVSSGEDALELLETEQFDVVFMDIHMPGKSGYVTTRRIREAMHFQPFIIALSANSLPEAQREASDAGMDAFLTKPFLLQDIEKMLRNVPPELVNS